GFEREDQIRNLLAAVPDPTDAVTPPLLRVDLRLGPWLTVDPADMSKGPRWLNLARDAFAAGGDRLQLELTAQRGELRLHGTLEEGYIRLLGAAWRAKHNQSTSPPSRNLAAPVQP
ncbi:MAG: hypothetical protein JNG89_01205, partial [Planctomycetaceae bacterium]|nr:hypothetical protein [Planctomycetaceae bacterium]